MNVTHTQLLTRPRAWMLVAGLTSLVILLGAMIGGVFAWLFAAIAVGANLLGYLYSDRIALRAVRAQALTVLDASPGCRADPTASRLRRTTHNHEARGLERV